MAESLISKAEREKFSELFLVDLSWHAPDHAPISVDLLGDQSITATNVASFKGVRVWEVPALLTSAHEAAVDQAIAKTSTNRLVIFHSTVEQIWRWPSRSARGAGITSRPARHRHKLGSNDPQFGQKLHAIMLPSDTVLDVNGLLTRIRTAFDVESKNESKRASKLMAALYSAVEKGYPPEFDPQRRDHEISVSLARVLFLLFGDDTEMWRGADGEPIPNLFQDFIKDDTARDGSDVAERLNDLFEALDTAKSQRVEMPTTLSNFPYVNGGIFKEHIQLPPLDEEFRNATLAACEVDWANISPAIFGSMFQSVRDARTRRELGEHYTSEENILKTLNPLFLDELNGEFAEAGARDTSQKRINALNLLWEKLGRLRYLDPACGCGNFIIVAYRELRDLELRIMDALATEQQGATALSLDFDWTHLLKVRLGHFAGIEIDEWPARIAETAMFLIDRQSDLRMRSRFGTAPERLPIQDQTKIVVGDALELNWSDLLTASENVVVAGNPPFLGHISRTATQTDQLRAAWGGADIGRLDYVTAWYAKAMSYFGNLRGRWAFVSTNSVTQGDQVARLFGPIFAAGWRVRFAHRTFAWSSEAAGGAAVHCNIIGFDRLSGRAVLFHYADPRSEPTPRDVSNINGYLVDGPNVMLSPRATPLSVELSTVTFGNMPRDGGHLVIEPSEHDRFMADPIAAKYVRPFLGSEELVRGTKRWCLWMTHLDFSDVGRSTLLNERIEAVREMRLGSKAPSTKAMAATPHLFGQRAAEMTSSYLAIPAVVSENRLYYTAARLLPEVIASNKLYVTSDHDGFLFAIVSSSMFLTWQFTVGNRLESRPSFSNTLVWNNFPLPKISETLRQEIIEHGAKINFVRESHPTKSLANLYEPDSMPADLLGAHNELDAAVDRAFELTEATVSTAERSAALLEMYSRLAPKV